MIQESYKEIPKDAGPVSAGGCHNHSVNGDHTVSLAINKLFYQSNDES